jgi:hypothetical protein
LTPPPLARTRPSDDGLKLCESARRPRRGRRSRSRAGTRRRATAARGASWSGTRSTRAPRWRAERGDPDATGAAPRSRRHACPHDPTTQARIARVGATATARPAKPLARREAANYVRRPARAAPPVVVRPESDDGDARAAVRGNRTRRRCGSSLRRHTCPRARARRLGTNGARPRDSSDERLRSPYYLAWGSIGRRVLVGVERFFLAATSRLVFSSAVRLAAAHRSRPAFSRRVFWPMSSSPDNWRFSFQSPSSNRGLLQQVAYLRHQCRVELRDLLCGVPGWYSKARAALWASRPWSRFCT